MNPILGYRKGQWQVAETEYVRMISIPLFPSISNDEATDAVDAIEKGIRGIVIKSDRPSGMILEIINAGKFGQAILE